MKLLSTAILAAALPMMSLAEGVTHNVAFHIDQNDPALMNMVLNNVQNLNNYYASKGDTAVIEVVAYGPGLNMYIADQSPVADRIASMALENDKLSFSACANTMAGIKKKTGNDVTLLSEAQVVPSGVVRLVELQEQGFAYVRP